MKYLSVCSGIEAATAAWHPLGWEPLAFSEIEPFPRKVLAHHYPDVPLHGDFTVLRGQDWIKDADILVGGTPCQAFSVAGLRNSLDDDRGNLTLEFVRLADAIDNLRSTGTIIVWENVPGVLSVKDNAFGCFLGALVGNDEPLVPTGGKWTNAGMVVGPQRRAAWRVLDAQYFGVAQRRRRVFVVASARDDIDPAEILFEREGVRRNTPPSRQTGENVAATIAARFGISRNNHEEVTIQSVSEVAPTLTKEGTGVVRPGFQEDGWYVAVAGSLDTQCGGGKLTHQSVANGHLVAARMVAFGEYVDDGTASTIKSRDWKDATDLVAQPIAFEPGKLKRLGYGNAEPGLSPTLRADAGDNQLAVAQPIAFNSKDYGSDATTDMSPTLRSLGAYGANGGGNMAVAQPIPLDMMNIKGRPSDDNRANRIGRGYGEAGDPMFTITKANHHGVAQPITFGAQMSYPQTDVDMVQTLGAKNPMAVTYSIMPMNSGKDYKAREVDVSQPIMAGGPVGGNQGGDYIVQAIALAENTMDVAPSVMRESGQGYWMEDCVTGTLRAEGGQDNVLVQAIALAENTIGRKPENGGNGDGYSEELMYTLNATGVHGVATEQPMAFQNTADCLTSSYGTKWNGNASATNGSLFAAQSMAVRRLTPRECERLQGFPDDYTAIPGASDGPRYKALGNSMAVPVMAWIGKRIAR